MKIKHHIGWVLVNSAALLVLFPLSGCKQMMDDNAREVAQNKANEDLGHAIEAEIAKNGFAVVGTTPDGKKLYMKEINVGFNTDHVYFTDTSKVSTVSTQVCGKGCIRHSVTVQ